MSATQPVVIAYIGLGSNLGDRLETLRRAVSLLEQRASATRGALLVSSLYETAAIGGPPDQPPYLNAVAQLPTILAPRALIPALLEIEASLGRVRRARHESRVIDLDLLLYGDQRIDEPNLVVPHPEMSQRSFVLEPLADLAPELTHPVLGRTIRQLASHTKQQAGQQVRRLLGPHWLQATTAVSIPSPLPGGTTGGRELEGTPANSLRIHQSPIG
jgi:2-amino-4-hydroxy-6-hydroxymethyldihydropteridine diphosphokinase